MSHALSSKDINISLGMIRRVQEILIGTGGGRAFADSSRPEFFNCTNIDVVTLHDYNAPNWTDMYNSIEKARDLGMKHGKSLGGSWRGLMERFHLQLSLSLHINSEWVCSFLFICLRVGQGKWCMRSLAPKTGIRDLTSSMPTSRQRLIWVFPLCLGNM